MLNRARGWLKDGLENGWTQLAVLLLLTASLVISIVIQFEVQGRSKCEENWSAAFTARTERITAQNKDVLATQGLRGRLLAHLIVGAIHGHRATQAELNTYVESVTAADKAEAAYEKALVDNPIPAAPKFAC